MKSFSQRAMTISHIMIVTMLAMLCPFAAQAQVSVSLSPVPKLQFLNNSGVPLANGCVSFFAAGTSTPQAAYTDSTGTVQLPNPMTLDAGGFSPPSGIWLANQSYKIKVSAAATGVVNCSSLGVTQYTIDGISSALGLLNLVNTWTASNTFTQPIIISAVINQLVLGSAGNQVTLNSPAPAGNVTINLPTTADTLVGLAATQTLTNKTLTAPVITNPSTTGTDNGAETLANKTLSSPIVNEPNLLISPTAPTIGAAACGGGGVIAPSIVNNNGPAAFTLNVGSPVGNTCTITLPSATTSWVCTANDITGVSANVFLQKQTAGTQTTATITNFSDVAAVTAFVASDILRVSCLAY